MLDSPRSDGKSPKKRKITGEGKTPLTQKQLNLTAIPTSIRLEAFA